VLPLRVLQDDVDKKESDSLTLHDGIGSTDWDGKKRLCRVSASAWKRDAIFFYTTEEAEYLLQQNEHTRSGIAKPSVFYNIEEGKLELFSFPSKVKSQTVTIWSIDLTKKAEGVKSSISDFIAIKCAQLVLDILGSQNSALMEKEFERKVNAL
jgi:hypothetical protein